MCHTFHVARVLVTIFFMYSSRRLIPLFTRTHRESALPITQTRHGRFVRERKTARQKITSGVTFLPPPRGGVSMSSRAPVGLLSVCVTEGRRGSYNLVGSTYRFRLRSQEGFEQNSPL